MIGRSPTGMSEEDTRVFAVALRYQQLWGERTGQRRHLYSPRARSRGGAPGTKDFRKGKSWVHFEKAEEMRARLGADLTEFLVAQFDMLADWKQCPYPYPSMLHSAGAETRYREWKTRRARERPTSPALTANDQNEDLVRQGAVMVDSWVQSRADIGTVDDVLRDPLLVVVLPAAYLRRSGPFQELVRTGWYKENWGWEPKA